MIHRPRLLRAAVGGWRARLRLRCFLSSLCVDWLSCSFLFSLFLLLWVAVLDKGVQNRFRGVLFVWWSCVAFWDALYPVPLLFSMIFFVARYMYISVHDELDSDAPSMNYLC
jgi:hypothetical protein